MYIISSISVFLIFYLIYTYIIILLENLFLYPLYPAFIISFILMLLQYFLFPTTLLKLIKPALNDKDIPKELEIFAEKNKNNKYYVWETKRPVIFHISMPFSKENILIVGRGLVNLLTSKELESLVKREEKRASLKLNNIFFMVGGIPFLMRHTCKLIKKLGSRGGAYGSAKSVMSFAGGFHIFIKFLYMIIYLVSREVDKICDSSFEVKDDLATILKKYNEFPPKEGTSEDRALIRSIDFLCFADPVVQNEGIEECLKTKWKNWYLLFKAHEPIVLRTGQIDKKISVQNNDKKAYIVTILLSISIIASIFVMKLGMNSGLFILLSAILLFILHFIQRPLFSKKQPDFEKLQYSPISGHQIAIMGTLKKKGFDKYIFESQDSIYRLYFYELSPVELDESEENKAIVAGWLKKSDRTYIEVMAIKNNGKNVYSSSHYIWYLLIDFVILLLGILMLSPHF